LAIVEGPPPVVALLTTTIVATGTVMMIGVVKMIGVVTTGLGRIGAVMIGIVMKGTVMIGVVMTGAVMIGAMIGVMMSRAVMIGVMISIVMIGIAMIGVMIGVAMSRATMRVVGAVGATAPLPPSLMFVARCARFMVTLPVTSGGAMVMILMMRWVVMSRRCMIMPMALTPTLFRHHRPNH
jgi:hypothetical protein